MLAERLWLENQSLADECLAHPFVQGIVGSMLDEKIFRKYIQQDAFFIEAFGRAYSALASRTSDWSSFVTLHELAEGIVVERRLHEDFARRWGTALQCDPLPATTRYVDHIFSTIFRADYALAPLAAMTPCMRLYSFLGQSIKQDPEYMQKYRDNKYSEWVDTYASDGFASLVSQLEGLVDKHCRDDLATHRAYRVAMECELDFFSAMMTGD